MINLYNIDCMTALKEMQDNQFDLAIVDPPYGIGNFCPENHTNKGSRKNKDGKWSKNNGHNTSSKKVEWNNNTPNQEFFAQLKRVSKEQIIWGANYYNCFSNNGGAIIWNKNCKHPNMSVCEIASYSKHKRVAYFESIWQNVNRKEITIHPCQKPIKLYEWLLMNYAKEGDKILDTHLGSGSIAIACYNLGFDLEGYELDKDYFDAAKKRLEQHQAQKRLF